MLRLAMAATLCTAALAGKSETPPEGPPWMRNLHAARTKALKEGKPLFLYFTKTY